MKRSRNNTKMTILAILIFCLLGLLPPTNISAQTYPVQTNVYLDTQPQKVTPLGTQGKYSISITKEGDKYTTTFKLLGKAANTTVQGQKAEIEKEVENAVNEKLNELGLEGKTSTAVNEDGFYIASMNGKQWLETLAELGRSVWEEAVLPKDYWKQNETGYNASTIHTPSLFSGVSDGVIQEVTAYPQLVKLGYEVAAKSEVRNALWNSVKNISISGIKTAATGAIKEKWDKYVSSPDYVTYHELGKDGAQVASLIYGGFAAKGKKVSEAVEESGKIVKKKADDIFEETWKLSKQKLGRAADSKVLSDNLEAVGRVRPDNSAAHHIVAGGANNPFAKDTRELLEKANIDINEAANGVFLPKNSKYVIDEALSHQNIHTKVYYEAVYDRLKDLPKENLRDELQRIANELSQGVFPY